MVDDVGELWMIIAGLKRDEAKSSMETQQRLMQEQVIEVCLQTEKNPEERKRRINRLFRFSGLTKDEWSELMPMEAQFA
jgi:hypothetical protein